MFKSTLPSAETMEDVLGCLESRVTPAMNEEFTKPFTLEEVEQALKQIHPRKSPDPDEALSGLIRQAESEGALQGVAVSRSAPPISHLLFVDNMLIFCQATQEALTRLQLILHSFEEASGLQINKKKYGMVFSKNVVSSTRLELAGILGVAVVAKHDKYLGLPTVTRRSKKEMFDGIKERIREKLHSWSTKKLSQASSVLLKSVIQSIPTYAMSCFRLPDSLLNELESLMAGFFWNCGRGPKIHWVSWAKMCKGKKEGGLGFRRLRECNIALLAKQAWRIIHSRGENLQSVLGQKNTSQLIRRPISLLEGARVSSLITAAHEWDEELIQAKFCPNNANCILGIDLPERGEEDTLIWHFSKKGRFSVGSAYYVATKLKGQAGCSASECSWGFLWKSKAPPKVVLFAWRCIHEALPTLEQLRRRGVRVTDGCGSCNSEKEMCCTLCFFVVLSGWSGPSRDYLGDPLPAPPTVLRNGLEGCGRSLAVGNGISFLPSVGLFGGGGTNAVLRGRVWTHRRWLDWLVGVGVLF
ncbi:UNVERIFIED_CONTAM: hypothetical protein Slati_0920000 [Sesamum latifolium]|uniref:Reverse transcriptase zinc-binding domain-containing protein n=1 Tax=Sesamum latifolium TaxID=2727402 RepID=A0AAW2XPJ7_9LAMI